MAIFKATAGKLKKLNIQLLKKERNLQLLLGDNLMEVLELRLFATEYATTFVPPSVQKPRSVTFYRLGSHFWQY